MPEREVKNKKQIYHIDNFNIVVFFSFAFCPCTVFTVFWFCGLLITNAVMKSNVVCTQLHTILSVLSICKIQFDVFSKVFTNVEFFLCGCTFPGVDLIIHNASFTNIQKRKSKANAS